MMNYLATIGGVILVVASVRVSHAGEVSGGFGSCELSTLSISRCEWKPKACFKPSQPIVMGYDVNSYNRSVDEYNSYLSEIEVYKRCIVEEAKKDEDAFNDTLVDGVKKAAQEIDSDAQSARSQLELSRPR